MELNSSHISGALKQKGMNDRRRIELTLRWAERCDKLWSQQRDRFHALHQLEHMVREGMESSEDPVLFERIHHLIASQWPRWNQRQLADFMVPLERYLDRNTTDHEILLVRQSDSLTSKNCETIPLIVLLDNVRSAFNVGSIFRSADCLKIQELFLCGYTASPENLRVRKASLGSERTVPWRHWEKTEDAIDSLRAKGISIVALETADSASNLFTTSLPQPTALLIGNERFGLPSTLLKLADEIVQIPTFGLKNSLNIAACLTTVGYEIRRQWKQIE
jgi:tRNA(Leu) C34 or U34 (ribose-2'-O)-methylase TrmL